MGRQVYENLKVLDVTNNYAGPMAGAMLADYGAEVWHVEKPVLGDDNRYFPPIIDGISINYCTSNRGKKSVVLDLKDPRGAEAFRKLAAQADVLLESYRPGVMKKLGLDYETLKEINPRLIYCSISAYGQEGPYANRPGYDVIAQAVSGMMEMTGEPDGPPNKIGSAIGDWMGALNDVDGSQAGSRYHWQDADQNRQPPQQPGSLWHLQGQEQPVRGHRRAQQQAVGDLLQGHTADGIDQRPPLCQQ